MHKNDKVRKNVAIYGTLGPACLDVKILKEMFQCGMTGIRLNLSHTSLKDAAFMIEIYQQAARLSGIDKPDLLIDMQGPEIRLGNLAEELTLKEGQELLLGAGGIPVPSYLFTYLNDGDQILLDDGKILIEMCKTEERCGHCRVLRGGILRSRKSIAVCDKSIPTPTLTTQDEDNLREALSYGVTGIMQPFVRNREDLITLRQTMHSCGCEDLSLFAKIENRKGVEHLEEFFDLADEIVIARGDLGNAMPLWQLPAIQKSISDRCVKAKMPFMVVTQMLASMEEHPLPTRAEVSDIFHAITDGATSVMVTGETALGKYPVEVIRYLSNTVKEAQTYLNKMDQ